MGLRHKSIRLRVLLLVLVPILSLIGVYAYTASVTAGAAISLAKARTVKAVIATPAGNLQSTIDAERHLALLYMATQSERELSALTLQESATDRAVKAFEAIDMSGALSANASAQEKTYATQLIKDLAILPNLRSYVEAGEISRLQVLNDYSNIITGTYRVLEGSIQQYSNIPLVLSAQNLINLDEVYQVLIQETDLYTSDMVARSFPPSDRAEFAQLAGIREYLLSNTLAQLSPTVQAIYQHPAAVQAADAVTHLENRIIHSRGLPPVSPTTWGTAVGGYAVSLGKSLGSAADVVTAKTESQARIIYLQLFLACGLGLLAIIFSILFSVLVGRGLIRQLAELRQSALQLANDRLPSVMARLRDGEDVDVTEEASPVEASADEIDQVRQAFNVVQRTAIQAAIDEAGLRRGVSDVFRNLARRNQVLLHRQLRLLDGMERRASEPDELEDLFRIDHLTTRMRRHAEGLIILSGESPGRTWRHPVPLMDVLRAAVAEVEDYTRIRVESRTRMALVGQAVADVIHLIAELAENATVFSPPNTQVRITGDTVGRGFAVEVEDRGLGITEERLTEINRNLADPPVFDLSGSDRLGLFIAGRLAARHGITISLRPSPYGGTTAIVIIPLKLLVSEDAYERVPAIGADGRSLPPGRHALTEARANGRDTGELPAVELDESWPRQPVTALPGARLESASPSGEFSSSEFPIPEPGLPTVPPPRPAAEDVPASVTPLPTSDEPGWWTRAASPAGNGSNGSAHGLDGQGLDGQGLDGHGLDGAGGDEAKPRATSAGLGGYDLPVRVRQASLAPQLRESAHRAQTDAGPASAEAARRTMAALQRGWERGRSGTDPSDGPPFVVGAPVDEATTDETDQ